MNYFFKELTRNKLNLPDGRKVTFEELGNGNGILATDDTFIISELRNVIRQHIHGVSEIDEVQYDELKKNSRVTPSQRKPAEQRSALSAQSLIHGHNPRAAAAVVKPKEPTAPIPEPPPVPPIKVQKEFVRPTTKKLFKGI